MERTRPVSARSDSSWTPRILCSRMEETSVGAGLASLAYVRAGFEMELRVRGAILALLEALTAPTAVRLDCRSAFLNILSELQA